MTDAVMEGYRLSPPQQRLWRLQAAGQVGTAGTRTPYWSQAVLELSARPEPKRLEAALRELVVRHELLRTRFASLPGMGLPLQVIGEDGPEPDLKFYDLTGRSLGSARRELEEALVEARRREVDWREGAALRATVLGPVGAAGSWWLALSLPSMYADGRGVSNLGRELARLYAAGAEPLDAEEPMQYADLSEWQNGLLESEETAAGREFWGSRGGETAEGWSRWAEHHVGGGFKGCQESGRECESGSASLRPARVRVALGGAGRKALAAAAESAGVSASEWVLACWALLWSRLSGQSRLALGVRFDGRRYEGLGDAPGLLARYLPLRVSVVAEAGAAQAARDVAEGCAELRKWQEYYPAEGEGSQEFGGVCYSYDGPGWSGEYGKLTWASRWEYECAEAFKVKLVCEGDEEGVLRGLSLHYDASRVSTGEAAELAEHLRSLLSDSARHRSAPASRLALLSARQRRRLIEEVCRGPRPEATGYATIHEAFERQASLTPDSPAVISESERLTYAELNASADRLAARLRGLGVGPESRVGLLLERSAGMVVALLATLKAGGAYVPLEAAWPDERLRYMVEDAALRVVITSPGQEQRAVGLGVEKVLSADALGADEGTEDEVKDASADGVEVSSDNLCYVIYTSGSTGRPKGVMVTHRQLLNYVSGASSRLGLRAGMGYALLTTFAADLGHTVTFPALCLGGRLHLPPEGAGADAAPLGAYLREHDIGCVKAVPSQMSALLAAGGAKVLPRTHLVLGGEALSRELARRVAEAARERVTDGEQSGEGFALFNHYGPTEATVGAAAGLVWAEGAGAGETYAGGGSVAIGGALAGVSVYVLDASGEVVPAGVAGEVYIGGAGVARGYLRRPALTAERFVPDPFPGGPGARMYRTGDVGRYSPGGRLEFIGRVDNQVKVRGYRIELGEIEAALRALQGVREAAVEARGDGDTEKRLVAYVVWDETAEKSVAELRRRLKERLPEYMVPSAFVELERLPLTQNGKVDRRALPELEADGGASGEQEEARTPVEELLCGIWAEVLGVGRVGVNDDFFELGGHSLLATQVVSRVNAAFGVEIPVGSIFDAPTAGGLARLVEDEIRAGVGVVVPPIVAVPRGGDLPLSFAQQRLWFLDQLEPGTSLYNIFRGVRLEGALDMRALEAALNELVRRHESLRTTFASDEGSPRQVIADSVPAALTFEDLGALPHAERETEVRRLVREESLRPFDLARGPLLRVRLLRLGDEEHVMLFALHHIIGDAWSIALLVSELATLYRAFRLNLPSPLAPLSVQYADYAVWQRGWLRGEVLAKHVAFWKGQLEGAPPVLELPADFAPSGASSLEGARHAAALGEELSRSLEALSRREGVTLFMTLLAAFKVLLRHRTGRADVVVGTDVANRNHLETEGVIGFFINQLVLRTDLSGDPTFRELLKSVRKTVWGAYTHQELPFDRLVEALNPERSLRYTPLFQVKFVFQDTRRGDEKATGEDEGSSGLRLTGLPAEGVTAKFDLTLNANRRPEALVYWVEYKTSLFKPSTVARFAELYEAILSHVVARPESRLGEIEESLAESDRQRRARLEKELREARRDKFKGLTRKTAAATRGGGDAL